MLTQMLSQSVGCPLLHWRSAGVGWQTTEICASVYVYKHILRTIMSTEILACITGVSVRFRIILWRGFSPSPLSQLKLFAHPIPSPQAKFA